MSHHHPYNITKLYKLFSEGFTSGTKQSYKILRTVWHEDGEDIPLSDSEFAESASKGTGFAEGRRVTVRFPGNAIDLNFN
jgi:hypothetical protein